MAPKHHPAPLSGGDRKALKKELSKSRAMTRIFAERSAEKRREGEQEKRDVFDALLNQAFTITSTKTSAGARMRPAVSLFIKWRKLRCNPQTN